MKSVMTPQQHFAQVPQIGNIQRSTFDRSKGHKSTFDSDFLVPFYLDEILPGDTQKVKTTIFARLATPLKPIMDNMYLETFYFFVPNRILWDNWEAFNGQNDTPLQAPIEYVTPKILIEASEPRFSQSLQDYFGIPVGVQNNDQLIQAMPFRAYNKIYNDWFKDENLIDNLTEQKGNGPDLANQYAVRKRGKRHDYFTSALPFPQKGDPVQIPLTGEISVVGDGTTFGLQDGVGGSAGSVTNSANQVVWDTAHNNEAVGNVITAPLFPLDDLRTVGVSTNPNDSGLIGLLSGVSALDVNALRDALAVQHVLEIDARGGTRYTEFLKAHFNVTSPDFRLQRAEYLGGSSDLVNISAIAQTSPSEISPGLTPQANLAATGTVASGRGGYTKSFTEHGWVIGILNVRADITYQQGLERFWRRDTRFDFYLPSFAHLGEQAILQSEIHYIGQNHLDQPVWGYQERFAEYRYNPSQISGYMRSVTSPPGLSLDVWHLSYDFNEDGGAPDLDQQFIESNTPIDRVTVIQEQPGIPEFIMDSYLDIKHTRAMPMYGVPGLRRF